MDQCNVRRRPITAAVDELVEQASVSADPKGRKGRISLPKRLRERAAATGLLPHEILLKVARGEPLMQTVIDMATGETKQVPIYPDMSEIMDAAKASAPYYAPKLSAVAAFQGISDDDLDAFIASAAAEAGVSLGTLGESEEGEGEEGEG